MPETPGPSQPPLPGAPGLASPGDSDVDMEAGSPASVHPLCLFPLGCWVLFIHHIPPDYTDPPSPRPLLGGEHVSHNLSFFRHFPGVQLFRDSCKNTNCFQAPPQSDVSQTPLFLHILDFPVLQSPAQHSECSCPVGSGQERKETCVSFRKRKFCWAYRGLTISRGK